MSDMSPNPAIIRERNWDPAWDDHLNLSSGCVGMAWTVGSALAQAIAGRSSWRPAPNPICQTAVHSIHSWSHHHHHPHHHHHQHHHHHHQKPTNHEFPNHAFENGAMNRWTCCINRLSDGIIRIINALINSSMILISFWLPLISRSKPLRPLADRQTPSEGNFRPAGRKLTD